MSEPYRKQACCPPGRLAGPCLKAVCSVLRTLANTFGIRISLRSLLIASVRQMSGLGRKQACCPPSRLAGFQTQKIIRACKITLQGRMILSAVPPCLYSVEILHFIGISLRKPISFFRCNGRMPDFSTWPCVQKTCLGVNIIYLSIISVLSYPDSLSWPVDIFLSVTAFYLFSASHRKMSDLLFRIIAFSVFPVKRNF